MTNSIQRIPHEFQRNISPKKAVYNGEKVGGAINPQGIAIPTQGIAIL
jgi:hypothetical protein